MKNRTINKTNQTMRTTNMLKLANQRAPEINQSSSQSLTSQPLEIILNAVKTHWTRTWRVYLRDSVSASKPSGCGFKMPGKDWRESQTGFKWNNHSQPLSTLNINSKSLEIFSSARHTHLIKMWKTWPKLCVSVRKLSIHGFRMKGTSTQRTYPKLSCQKVHLVTRKHHVVTIICVRNAFWFLIFTVNW